ncbi:toxin glutamine deamidase domain-containing protein [Chryseobacterium sp. JK1]|uniref:toxin glutamine deamidase domain-containing protein n=1 Tax=Chryseobacterium sp. JK1 TaxID=874294 RepID=UPI003D689EF0
MTFDTHQQKGRLLKTLYDTGKTTTEMRPGLKTDNLVPTQVPIIDQFWYHPFYPIYLKDIENQETELKLDSVVPAFMLKANHEKQFWSNVITTAEYAADILTTVSGVGNIGKFRYLVKFAAKAEKLSFVSKAGRAVANVRKAVAATAAVVEITSGTVNTLLKLSGARDAAWSKSLSEYLFWLELLSLSGELSVAIHNGLRKSAKEILEHEDDIRNSAKNVDEAKQIDELIEDLFNVSEKAGGANKKLFAIWKINLKEGRFNCANTAIATDAMLAGRPASALPYTIQRRWKNGRMQNYASFDKGTFPDVLEKEFNAKFTGWNKNLNKLVEDLEPGKRGIIFGIKDGKNLGHFFNVINDKGVIKFLDGQTGKRAKLVYDNYQFLPTN